ncbi:sodium/glutamate symporter [Kistimonas scapharcae]|uniref:Sodium/glutamate symporter n=1 Tax=Kistimonas scapharcae TaxID=1036133 RepID=A0ABP8UXW3_9GAMM
MTITFAGINLLLASIVVLYIGHYLTRKSRFLQEYNIPAPVTGGLLSSVLLTLIASKTSLSFHFDLELRDLLLLMFFSTIGLNARFSLLLSGGKTLTILLFVMLAFLILQNTTGVLFALFLDQDPVNGLLAGSIAFAGGHGTAITWGSYFEQNGHPGSQEFGLIAATLGLILGGTLGGPLAHNLIKQHALYGNQHRTPYVIDSQSQKEYVPVDMTGIFRVLLEISITISVGLYLHQWLESQQIILPEFLPVLLIGIIIANLGTVYKHQSDTGLLSLWGDVSLELFIAMSLLSLQLGLLANTASSLVIITIAQTVISVLFVYFIVFRFAGRDYDAAVISSGFIGSGLGATPVGMANVETITSKFGPSPKALLIIPLLGSFFTDVLNALVLKGFLTLPFFQ